MKTLSKICLPLLIISSMSFAATNNSKKFSGAVELTNGQKIFIDYQLPKTTNDRTVILLNGLTYNTENWDRFVVSIKDESFGILRYDMRGMGKTFKMNGPVTSPIPFMDQVEDLKHLILDLNLTKKPIIMGLSYGGGIALAFAKTYPDLIEQAILLAPYTKPLAGQDTLFKNIIFQENMIRSLFFLPTKDPDKAYSDLLKHNVDTVYPYMEPGDWNGDAVFNLTEGIRVWNALEDYEIINLNAPKKITLVAAILDQYVEYNTLFDLAKILGKNGALNKFEKVWSEHKIPESNPYILKSVLKEVIKDLN